MRDLSAHLVQHLRGSARQPAALAAAERVGSAEPGRGAVDKAG